MYVNKTIPLFSQSLSCFSFNFKVKARNKNNPILGGNKSAPLLPNSNFKQKGHCLKRQIIFQDKVRVCNRDITNSKVFEYRLFHSFFSINLF